MPDREVLHFLQLNDSAPKSKHFLAELSLTMSVMTLLPVHLSVSSLAYNFAKYRFLEELSRTRMS